MDEIPLDYFEWICKDDCFCQSKKLPYLKGYEGMGIDFTWSTFIKRLGIWWRKG